jgi:hypothetical protein
VLPWWGFFWFALIALWATDGYSQSAATLWEHNGSLVSLSANGSHRQFHYQAPAADLLQLGVQPGTLLFDGRRDGARYAGTAYVFSRACGPLPYPVAGPVSPDQRSVTMYGKAPVVDANCLVVASRDDVLVFNFTPPAETSTNEAQRARDVEWEAFVEQWHSCFSSASNVDFLIRMCDLALTYGRLIENDRAKLVQRRAALAQGNNPLGEHKADATAEIGNRSGSSDQPSPSQNTSSSGAPPPIVIAAGIIIAIAALMGVLWAVPTMRASPVPDASVRDNQTQMAIRDPTPTPPSETPPVASVSHEESTIDQSAPTDVREPMPTQRMPLKMSRSMSEADSPPAAVGAQYMPIAHPRKMQLKIKRSQRSSVMGKVIYILDARIEVPTEERQLIEKYRLGDLVIYDSTNRKKHGESLQQHIESTRENPSLADSAETQLLGVGKTLYRFARAGLSATAASLSLRVTVYSLIKGVHVECKSMVELLGAEEAIVDAGKNLRAYIDTATTFDGREEILEF